MLRTAVFEILYDKENAKSQKVLQWDLSLPHLLGRISKIMLEGVYVERNLIKFFWNFGVKRLWKNLLPFEFFVSGIECQVFWCPV